MKLLTQNSELRPDGIFNWSLPAFGVRLSNGQTMNVCPTAGACASFCYARNGTYNFSNVKSKHIKNLEYTLYHPEDFVAEMIEECLKPKMKGKYVRIHDAGDFYSETYLNNWLRIIKACAEVTFYAYTKEVSMLRKQTNVPSNFRYLFSTGGLEDHLIGDDRHADVFVNEQAIKDAGYVSQDESDLLCVLLASNKIGIPANNIPKFNKMMNGRRFSELSKPRV